jgi:hypothetical protein
MLECAPMGKFARAVHQFACRKSMPVGFGVWAVLSMPIGAYWATAFLMTPSAEKGVAGRGFISIVLLLPLLYFLLKTLSRPTHICVSREGLSYCWRYTFAAYGPTLKWRDITMISVLQPQNTSRVQSRLLRFRSPQRAIDLRVDEVTEPSLLPVLFKAIEENAPTAPRDPELQSMLGADCSHESYTELWLKALTAPPQRNRLAPLTEGTSLQGGEYRILQRIGSGGQGVAYTAIRRSQGDTVVLKEYVLPVGVSYGSKVESLEKFQREAQILGQIEHQQIVTLLDFFFEDHRGYIVLDFVQGKSLQSLVFESGPLAEDKVIDLALQMSDILSYLHFREPAVVHRDFTPDNLMLSSNGVLKLIDFNVAQQKRTTATATVVGKHAYIAPDQFRGQATPQSDIYSLGASLFFLLTGSEPKPITSSHPKQKNDAVSSEMDTIVAACTAIDTNTRYESAARLSEALHKLKQQRTAGAGLIETRSLEEPESPERQSSLTPEITDTDP